MTGQIPRRATPEDLPRVLDVVAAAFAGMAGRIDPPSSARDLTIAALAQREVWVAGTPVVACMTLEPAGDLLLLGKLAVWPDWQGQGLGRWMVDAAVAQAAQRGFHGVVLQTRIELVENHAAFRAMGFVEVARTAHPGFDRPTSLTFRKALPEGAPR
jgi:predicted N-acetyltransferase YhbS